MDLIPTVIQDAVRCFSCVFAPDDQCFHGHFPGHPVVPGSFLVGLCVQIVQTEFCCAQPVLVDRFSFRHFVAPGSYTLCVRMDAGVFECTLTQDAQVFAKGRIRVCA
ncbi:hypothetical protein MASR1M90_06040 [Desulfovibrionales bacterium]